MIQPYEGGHTLYGPHTLDFLIQQSVRLSRDLQQQGNIDQIPRQQTFSLLSRQYFPEMLTAPGPRRWVNAPTHHQGNATTGPYWSLELSAEAASRMTLDRPLLAIDCHDHVITDESAELQLLHLRWYPGTQPPSRPCRFAVDTGERQPLFSAPVP